MDAHSFLKFCLGFVIPFILLLIIKVEARHPASKHKSSIVLPLFHRDDPSSPLMQKMQRELGREEKLAAMVRRDAARVQGISARVRGAMKVERKRGNGHVRAVEADMGRNASAPVSNGLSDGSGEFFTTMGIGYRDFSLVMDTGSDLVWLQCLPCDSCYEQTDPLFDPAFSSTFSPVNCQSRSCSQADIMSCRSRFCEYQQSYGDGSFTIGSIVKDTFYMNNTTINSGIVMGCGHDNEGLFVGAAGLLGLGRGLLSFPSQAAMETGGVFSYCLSAMGPGALIFGETNEAKEEGENRVYTPMLRNPVREMTFYYVPIVGISIGGEMVEGIGEADFEIRETGRGGVILDSGTTITRFVGGVYYPMRDAYREAASMRGYRAAGAYSIFDTCYFAPPQGMGGMPTIELHFEGGSLISLGPQNSLYPIDDELPLLCFAFAPTTSDFSILGNVQQQGFLITFDTAASRLGFLNNQCSPPPIS